jgi:hydrogenase maturation protease
MHGVAGEKAIGDLLVIGYGNTLRRDDGVGPRVAEAVAELNLSNISCIVCHQLTPELAQRISRSRRVVFVDATVNLRSGIQMEEVTPAETSRILAHVVNPRTVLALARDIFGRCPIAWILTIGIKDTDLGEELSPVGRKGMQEAIELIRNLVVPPK